MIDDKLLLAFAIGAVPSLVTLIITLVNRHDTHETALLTRQDTQTTALITALQKELERKDKELERRDAQIEQERQLAEGWRQRWNELFATAQERTPTRLPEDKAVS